MKTELQYVRTDRNGTKYYNDYTCPRCCGYGELDKWQYTGRTCFACGGTGKRPQPKVVKVYTPEYEAKLDAKRAAKYAAQQAEREAQRVKYDAEHADEIEAQRRRVIETRYAEHGCGKNGIGYVLTGKTFPAKEEIKQNGGKWICGVWVCPVEIKGKGIISKEINLTGHIGAGSETWLDDFDLYEALHGE